MAIPVISLLFFYSFPISITILFLFGFLALPSIKFYHRFICVSVDILFVYFSQIESLFFLFFLFRDQIIYDHLEITSVMFYSGMFISLCCFHDAFTAAR